MLKARKAKEEQKELTAKKKENKEKKELVAKIVNVSDSDQVYEKQLKQMALSESEFISCKVPEQGLFREEKRRPRVQKGQNPKAHALQEAKREK